MTGRTRGAAGNPCRTFDFTGAADVLTEIRALVAQLVEQRFCKPKVGGSIPSGGTIKTKQNQMVIYLMLAVLARFVSRHVARGYP